MLTYRHVGRSPSPQLWLILLPLSLAASLSQSMPALAQSNPEPFAHGDPKIGKMLDEKDCESCHARRFEGHPEQMYLRPEHHVHTPRELAAQVAYCNSQLGTGLFPEEEEHVEAYLNLPYSKFKP